MKHHGLNLEHSDSVIMQFGTPVKMLIACLISCVLGILLMWITSNYLLMAVFIFILICMSITTPLVLKGKISVETACLIPTLILCFVYTPLSWYAFDGLLGCTPYLSILFFTVIILTYYRKIQAVILALYSGLMAGLTVHWFMTWSGERDLIQVINILIAYVLTVSIILFIAESVKRKNYETTRQITDLSMRDELTGLLNRRAIEQVLQRAESVFAKGGTEYAIVMMDIDRFKSINDIYGHNFGDSALKSLAACIQKNIRAKDYAFRYGGDEFLLVLPSVDQATVTQVCERIMTALREVQGYAFPITISTGHALRSEGTSPTETLNLADQRMYCNKRGKSQNENTPGA